MRETCNKYQFTNPPIKLVLEVKNMVYIKLMDALKCDCFVSGGWSYLAVVDRASGCKQEFMVKYQNTIEVKTSLKG